MEKLAKILAQEDTVLFIGSGISLWSGLPSWGGLIEQLAVFLEELGIRAELIRTEASRGDFLQAASYGFDKLTKAQIGEFIRQACNYGHAKPHEIHKKIISLGPTCYVTTNYDNLIEESLRLWQPHLFFASPVTNRQLTNLADIVGARSKNFIFKPHGDAADSESIILSREQYRQLLPDGERHATLESVKMLMATRPVVYLGFGLRDPDFLYVKDLLANTYQGGTRDHFAVIADCTEEEAGYWRKNYGINLVGYKTTINADGKRNHNELLSLLDSFQPTQALHRTLEEKKLITTDIVLALARHAGRLSRVQKNEPEFPIRVHIERQTKRIEDWNSELNRYDHLFVDKFLDKWQKHAVLIGLPGAGKSYSLAQAVARLAEQLSEACREERFSQHDTVVPIFADIKLYSGSIRELINESLPNGISLEQLKNQFKLRIFLDSFNEMPREYWDNASYEEDFRQFIEGLSDASLIISSRTSDGLSKLGLPCFSLDQIDEKFVLDELESHDLMITGRFEREILALLQKPFYFQLVINQKIHLPTEAHPRDFYQIFFNNLSKSFNQRFRTSFNLEYALSLTAYKAIDKGEEAQSLSTILEVLNTQLSKERIESIDAITIANWLVSKSIIIPYIGGRAAFFHQSATEYLAASELARRFIKNPHIVQQKLTLTNWDQTLFLTLSQLNEESAKLFLDYVTRADFVLALNATKYLEYGRDEIISKLLTEIPSSVNVLDPFEWDIQDALEEGIPVTDVHEPQLREIIKCKNIIGGAAVRRLVELKGYSVKDEMMELIAANPDDYNFCTNGIGPAIQPYITSQDINKMLALIDAFEGKFTEQSCQGLINGFSVAFQRVSVAEMKAVMFPTPNTELSQVRAHFLCDFLRLQSSTEALNFAGELLLCGVKMASVTIYFIKLVGRNTFLSWRSFNKRHAECLIRLLDDSESWALSALKCLCLGKPNIASFIRSKAAKASGLHRAAFLYCSRFEFDPLIFEAFEELLNLNESDRRKQPFHLISQIEIDWKGREELFVSLLKLKDTEIAKAILDLNYEGLGMLQIGPIEWWLDWLIEIDNDDSLIVSDRIPRLFANHLQNHSKREFLREFNQPESKYRKVLSLVLPIMMSELITDDFTEETILYLLEDISNHQFEGFFEEHILASTATEAFVNERLLPLLNTQENLLLRVNLKKILNKAGERHGRRYTVVSV